MLLIIHSYFLLITVLPRLLYIFANFFHTKEIATADFLQKLDFLLKKLLLFSAPFSSTCYKHVFHERYFLLKREPIYLKQTGIQKLLINKKITKSSNHWILLLSDFSLMYKYNYRLVMYVLFTGLLPSANQQTYRHKIALWFSRLLNYTLWLVCLCVHSPTLVRMVTCRPGMTRSLPSWTERYQRSPIPSLSGRSVPDQIIPPRWAPISSEDRNVIEQWA